MRRNQVVCIMNKTNVHSVWSYWVHFLFKRLNGWLAETELTQKNEIDFTQLTGCLVLYKLIEEHFKEIYTKLNNNNLN